MTAVALTLSRGFLKREMYIEFRDIFLNSLLLEKMFCTNITTLILFAWLSTVNRFPRI